MVKLLPDKIDRGLQSLIMALIVLLVSLNLYMVWQFKAAMSVRPKQVLESLEEKLSVTPEMVMERLDKIQAEHMKFVEEHREAKANIE